MDDLRTIRDKLAHALLGKQAVTEASGQTSRGIAGYEIVEIPLNTTEEVSIDFYSVKQDSALTVRGARSMSLVQLAEVAVPQLHGLEDGKLKNCQVVNYTIGETAKLQCARMGRLFTTLLGIARDSPILSDNMSPLSDAIRTALKRCCAQVAMNGNGWTDGLECVHRHIGDVEWNKQRFFREWAQGLACYFQTVQSTCQLFIVEGSGAGSDNEVPSNLATRLSNIALTARSGTSRAIRARAFETRRAASSSEKTKITRAMRPPSTSSN